MQTIIEGVLPPEFMLQIQSGLLISERKWCDFISFSGGMPMFVLRVLPDLEIQKAIIEAATAFEARLTEKLQIYSANAKKFYPTERIDYGDIFV